MSEFTLDIRTLAAVAAMVSVLQAFALTALWRAAPESRGTPQWAAGGLMLAVGMLLISFRNLIPDSLSIIVANVTIVGSHIAFLIGIERYRQRPTSLPLGVTIAAATLVGFLYFTYATPDLTARIVLVSALLFALSCGASWRLAQGRRGRLAPIEWLLIILFAAHALFHLLRGVYTALDDRLANDFMSASIVHATAFLDIVVFSFATGIAFSVMTVLRLNQSLTEELEMRSGLLSIIAHDVRTPFNGLVNMATIINASLQSGQIDRAKRFATEVAASSGNVLDLLEDLIQWGKSEFVGERAPTERLDIGAAVDSECEKRRRSVTEKGLTIVNRAQGLEVDANASHVHMVLRNLLSNALKFAPSHSAIEVAGTENASGVQLTIVNQVADRKADADGLSGMGVGLELCTMICAKNGHHLQIRQEEETRFVADFRIRAPV